MSNVGLVIGWVLVVLAFLSAVVSTLSKPLREGDSDSVKSNSRWWQRITTGGWFMVFLAILTAVVAIVNVWLVEKSQKELAGKVSGTYKELIDEVKRARAFRTEANADRVIASQERTTANDDRKAAAEERRLAQQYRVQSGEQLNSVVSGLRLFQDEYRANFVGFQEIGMNDHMLDVAARDGELSFRTALANAGFYAAIPYIAGMLVHDPNTTDQERKQMLDQEVEFVEQLLITNQAFEEDVRRLQSAYAEEIAKDPRAGSTLEPVKITNEPALDVVESRELVKRVRQVLKTKRPIPPPDASELFAGLIRARLTVAASNIDVAQAGSLTIQIVRRLRTEQLAKEYLGTEDPQSRAQGSSQ